MARQFRRNLLYEFGDFRLDASERLLFHKADLVPLTPRLFDILLELVQNAGHILEKDELIKAVWADAVVEEGNLARNISSLRKALGEDPNRPRYIETIPWRGYRFLGPVRECSNETTDIIVEEHSRSSLTIEEEGPIDGGNSQAPQTRFGLSSMVFQESGQKHRARALLVTACVVTLGIGGALVLSRHSNVPAAADFRSTVRSIAVLPFKPLSQDGRDEYLELGMADTLITRLSSLNRLIVRPTSAVRKYVDPNQDPTLVGRELKVDAVLDGSLQIVGDRVRVTVRLMRVQDGHALWAQQFDTTLGDVLKAEDTISEQVASSLALKLNGDEQQRLTRRYTENAEAYQLYLRGRYFWNKRTGDSLDKGTEYFESAIKLDPGYARAYAGLADCYILRYDRLFLSHDLAIPPARAAVTRALELDDTLPEAHASLAYIRFLYDHEWEVAEREFRRAIELNPNDANAHHWYGRFLLSLGRFDEAMAELHRAQELDPLSLIINTSIGGCLFYSRQYDRAVEELKKTIEIDPGFTQPHWLLGQTFERKGMYPEAVQEYQDALSGMGDQAAAASLGRDFKEAGFETAMRRLTAHWEVRAKTDWAVYHSIARNYAMLGDNARALDWLERCNQWHHPWLIQLKVEPQFDGLRSDPRFIDLLRAMNLN